jgi:hypothetical protein
VHWVLLDIGIAVLAVLFVLALALGLYKRIRVLLKAVGTASRTLGEVTAGLSIRQPPSDGIRR